MFRIPARIPARILARSVARAFTLLAAFSVAAPFAAPIALAVGLASGTPARAGEVTVFAAASLGGVIEAIAAPWEAETGHEVRLSAAGSSAIARQIAAGAPAEVVISASEAWMDWLEARDAIEPGTRRELLGNRRVLIGPAGTEPMGLADALEGLGEGRLATALTAAVPAGIYAREALEAAGLWETAAPRLAETDNVRAALALVAYIFFRAIRTPSSGARGGRPVRPAMPVSAAADAQATGYGMRVWGAGRPVSRARVSSASRNVRFTPPRT